jgi:hypothetical protein
VRGYPKGIYNESTFIVADYFTRLTLRKAGLVSDFESLDCLEVNCYCIIANELAKMEREASERAKKKKGR